MPRPASPTRARPSEHLPPDGSVPARRCGLLAAVLFVLPACVPGAPSPCGTNISKITCENSLPGNPASEWDVVGSGDPSIVGFTTNFSVNHGQPVGFKVSTHASAYTIDIYRMGWYQGNGARKVASITPSATLPQIQPAVPHRRA